MFENLLYVQVFKHIVLNTLQIYIYTNADSIYLLFIHIQLISINTYIYIYYSKYTRRIIKAEIILMRFKQS